MPYYEYECTDCGFIDEMVRTIDRRNDPAHCAKCEGRMNLHFAAPRALRTDTAFQAGFGGDGCTNELMRRQLQANAKRMGVNIQGKKYDPRLAKFPGDPGACYGTVNEARKAIVRSGQSSEQLGVKPAPDTETGKPYRVADNIVENHAREKVISEHGGTVTRQKWETMKQEVRERITPAPALVPEILR